MDKLKGIFNIAFGKVGTYNNGKKIKEYYSADEVDARDKQYKKDYEAEKEMEQQAREKAEARIKELEESNRNLYIPGPLLIAIDKYAKKYDNSRSKAVQVLIENGLKQEQVLIKLLEQGGI